MLILRAIAKVLLRSVTDIDIIDQIGGGRQCSRLGKCNRLPYESLGLTVDCLKFGTADDARLDNTIGKHLNAVLVGPDVVNLALGAVGLLVALEMAEHADHLAFKESRAATFTRSLNDFARRLVDGEKIKAVNGHAGKAETCGAVHIGVDGDGIIPRGGFGIAVVLDYKDCRQVPHGGEVEALEEGALVRGTIPDKGNSHSAIAAILRGKGCAANQRRAGTEDAIGAHHALRKIGDVHGAAFAATGPRYFPVDFRHHFPRIHPLGDAMAMAAVG